MPCQTFTLVIDPAPPTAPTELCDRVDGEVCLTRILTDSVTVSLSRDDNPTGVQQISGSSDGSSAASGTLSATASLVGASVGTATATGTLVDSGTVVSISGSAGGSSAAFGTLTGRGILEGTAASSSTASGTLSATGAIEGTAAGSSTASGTLVNAGSIGALEGTAASSSTASGTVTGQGALSGIAASSSTATGTITGTGSLAGTSAATSTATGTISTAGGPSFVPSDVASYWESWTTDISPTTDATAVTSWQADSGDASRDLTTVSSVTTDNGGLDGQDTVALGSTSSIGRTFILDPLVGDTSWEVFIVADVASGEGDTGATNYWVNGFLFGDPDQAFGISVDTAGVAKFGLFVAGADIAVEDSGFSIASAGPVVIRCQRSGGDLTIQVQNRTPVVNSTGNTATPAAGRGVLIGNQGTAGFVGSVAVWGFTDVLGASDRADMYTYLVGEYPSITVP